MASNYTNDSTLYLLNGSNIKTVYSVYIEKASGFLALPRRKESLSNNWLDENGLEIDLTSPKWEARRSNLDCFILGTTYSDVRTKIKTFINEMIKPGLHHLKLSGVPGIFLVYVEDGFDPERGSRLNDTKSICSFSLPLAEPYPFTRQFLADRSASIVDSATLTYNTSKAITIAWGDGTYSVCAVGSGVKSHFYSTLGVYCIVVYQGTDGIITITPTNCTEIL